MTTGTDDATSTRDILIASALELLDSNAGNDFTLRDLAKTTGVSHTTVYKHFRSKDDLLAQAFVSIYTEEVLRNTVTDESPRARITAMCLALRRSYVSHPRLVSAMVLASGTYSQSQEFQQVALACLRGMGVNEGDVPIYYQALESFLIGGSYFDFHAYPDHLLERRSAYGALPLDSRPSTESEVWELNERAFETGLNALLDQMVLS